MRVYPVVLFQGADLSQATLTSEVYDLNHMYGYAIQFVYTGTAVGVLTVQASCDMVQLVNASRIVNWSPLVDLPLVAPGSNMYNVIQGNYRWGRVVYTRTSGSGALNTILNAKGP